MTPREQRIDRCMAEARMPFVNGCSGGGSEVIVLGVEWSTQHNAMLTGRMAMWLPSCSDGDGPIPWFGDA